MPETTSGGVPQFETAGGGRFSRAAGTRARGSEYYSQYRNAHWRGARCPPSRPARGTGGAAEAQSGRWNRRKFFWEFWRMVQIVARDTHVAGAQYRRNVLGATAQTAPAHAGTFPGAPRRKALPWRSPGANQTAHGSTPKRVKVPALEPRPAQAQTPHKRQTPRQRA